MRFVVKDLMITVLPVGFGDLVGEGGQTCLCTKLTGQTKGSACTDCCPDIVFGGSLDQLAAVREQLRASLAAVEAQEEVVIESLRPRNPAEVELVRGLLTEALDELNRTQPKGSGGRAKGSGGRDETG